jgi:tRNA threonylcarbamoyladenosine biosynthesis protein TsaB
MTTLLAIDTAAPRLQLALLMGERTDTLVEDMPTGQAERIFPAIAELLARNGMAYADLTRVAVTTGPGSFTGLRIGLSAARGLGLALTIPVLGLPTMSALSLIAPEKLPVAVLIDAKRGEMYRQEFLGPLIELHDRDFRPKPTPAVFDNIGPPRSVLKLIVKFSHVLGSGAAQAAAATGATDLESARPESDRGFVDIERVARWAATVDPGHWPPEPVYGRDADAKPQEKFRVAKVTA